MRVIAQRMRELRRRYGMTQEQFAAKIGVQPHSIYNYESLGNRGRSPSFECLQKIAGACGCDAACFLLLGKRTRGTLLDDPRIRESLRELLGDEGAN